AGLDEGRGVGQADRRDDLVESGRVRDVLGAARRVLARPAGDQGGDGPRHRAILAFAVRTGLPPFAPRAYGWDDAPMATARRPMVNLLGRVPLFEGCTRLDLSRVASLSEERIYREGQ